MNSTTSSSSRMNNHNGQQMAPGTGTGSNGGYARIPARVNHPPQRHSVVTDGPVTKHVAQSHYAPLPVIRHSTVTPAIQATLIWQSVVREVLCRISAKVMQGKSFSRMQLLYSEVCFNDTWLADAGGYRMRLYLWLRSHIFEQGAICGPSINAALMPVNVCAAMCLWVTRVTVWIGYIWVRFQYIPKRCSLYLVRQHLFLCSSHELCITMWQYTRL